MTDTGSNRESAITFLHRNWVAGAAIDLNSRRLREVAFSRQETSMRTTNEEARRRARDTDPDNWSNAADPGGNDRHPWVDDLEVDHWEGFVYKADHFTWTHKCGQRNCKWQCVSQTEVNYCQKCHSSNMFKYPTFKCSWRVVSSWFYFCSACSKFSDRSIHCERECVDVYALKRDRQSRFRM